MTPDAAAAPTDTDAGAGDGAAGGLAVPRNTATRVRRRFAAGRTPPGTGRGRAAVPRVGRGAGARRVLLGRTGPPAAGPGGRRRSRPRSPPGWRSSRPPTWRCGGAFGRRPRAAARAAGGHPAGARAANAGDVPGTYAEPHDPRCPVACVDGVGRPLVGGGGTAPRPRRVAGRAGPRVRGAGRPTGAGPSAGRRHASVAGRMTGVEFARPPRAVSGGRHPGAGRAAPACGGPGGPAPAARCAAFDAAEAGRAAARFEWPNGQARPHGREGSGRGSATAPRPGGRSAGGPRPPTPAWNS